MRGNSARRRAEPLGRSCRPGFAATVEAEARFVPFAPPDAAFGRGSADGIAFGFASAFIAAQLGLRRADERRLAPFTAQEPDCGVEADRRVDAFGLGRSNERVFDLDVEGFGNATRRVEPERDANGVEPPVAVLDRQSGDEVADDHSATLRYLVKDAYRRN